MAPKALYLLTCCDPEGRGFESSSTRKEPQLKSCGSFFEDMQNRRIEMIPAAALSLNHFPFLL